MVEYEDGYYKVIYEGKREIAEYSIEYKEWYRFGKCDVYETNEFDEILEKIEIDD